MNTALTVLHTMAVCQLPAPDFFEPEPDWISELAGLSVLEPLVAPGLALPPLLGLAALLPLLLVPFLPVLPLGLLGLLPGGIAEVADDGEVASEADPLDAASAGTATTESKPANTTLLIFALIMVRLVD